MSSALWYLGLLYVPPTVVSQLLNFYMKFARYVVLFEGIDRLIEFMKLFAGYTGVIHILSGLIGVTERRV